MVQLLKSKLGEGGTEGMWKLIMLMLAILTVIAVGVGYYYATGQSERAVHNLTRVFRGFA